MPKEELGKKLYSTARFVQMESTNKPIVKGGGPKTGRKSKGKKPNKLKRGKVV